MFLLVLAHPGCPGQNPESHKMVVVVVVVIYTQHTTHPHSNGPCMVSKHETAVAPTSKRHYTKYYVIMWPRPGR